MDIKDMKNSEMGRWVQGVQTNMLLIIQLLREAAEARLSRKEATLKKS